MPSVYHVLPPRASGVGPVYHVDRGSYRLPEQKRLFLLDASYCTVSEFMGKIAACLPRKSTEKIRPSTVAGGVTTIIAIKSALVPLAVSGEEETAGGTAPTSANTSEGTATRPNSTSSGGIWKTVVRAFNAQANGQRETPNVEKRYAGSGKTAPRVALTDREEPLTVAPCSVIGEHSQLPNGGRWSSRSGIAAHIAAAS